MNEFKVSDYHRTNEMSLIPGGEIVKILHQDGKIRIYDKVKNVRSYISAALEKDPTIVKIWCDDFQVWPPKVPPFSTPIF
jgi:hypothetical protein